MVIYREHLPVKNNGFKTMIFMRIFEEALKGLIRPLRDLCVPWGPYKALSALQALEALRTAETIWGLCSSRIRQPHLFAHAGCGMDAAISNDRKDGCDDQVPNTKEHHDDCHEKSQAQSSHHHWHFRSSCDNSSCRSDSAKDGTAWGTNWWGWHCDPCLRACSHPLVFLVSASNRCVILFSKTICPLVRVRSYDVCLYLDTWGLL